MKLTFKPTSNKNILYSVREFNGMRVYIDLEKHVSEIRDKDNNTIYSVSSTNREVMRRNVKKELIRLGVTFKNKGKQKNG